MEMNNVNEALALRMSTEIELIQRFEIGQGRGAENRQSRYACPHTHK